MRLLKQAKAGKKVHIIHLGDHDPSGIDMSRDIEDRIRLFVNHHLEPVKKIRHNFMKRIALNMDQVREYNPPPNPAKLSDSRATSYIGEHGDESWELDALEPAVLTALIREEVEGLRDSEAWEEATEREETAKEQLTKVAEQWEIVTEGLE